MKTEKQLQLVTFEQAKRLKEAGFKWGTKHYYDNPIPNVTQKGLDYNNMVYLPHYAFSGMEYNSGENTSCPTVALALQWFRDAKGFHNGINFYDVISPEYIGTFQVPRITDVGEKRYTVRKSYQTESKKTHESAESALLDELLTLIEKEK